MRIEELAVQYRESSEKCRRRQMELKSIMLTALMSETERLLLRRRIYMLGSMAREAMATSNYLKNYYGKRGGEDESECEDERICA